MAASGEEWSTVGKKGMKEKKKGWKGNSSFERDSFMKSDKPRGFHKNKGKSYGRKGYFKQQYKSVSDTPKTIVRKYLDSELNGKSITTLNNELINSLFNKICAEKHIIPDNKDGEGYFSEMICEIISLCVIDTYDTHDYIMSLKDIIHIVRKSKSGYGLLNMVAWSRAKSMGVVDLIQKEKFLNIYRALIKCGCNPFDKNDKDESVLKSYIVAVEKGYAPDFDEVKDILKDGISEKTLISIFNKTDFGQIKKLSNQMKYVMYNELDKSTMKVFNTLMNTHQFARKNETYSVLYDFLEVIKAMLLNNIIDDEYKHYIEDTDDFKKNLYYRFFERLNYIAINYDLSKLKEEQPFDMIGAIIGEYQKEYEIYVNSLLDGEINEITSKLILTSTAHFLWSHERSIIYDILNDISDEELKRRYVKLNPSEFQKRGERFNFTKAVESINKEKVTLYRKIYLSNKNNFLQMINEKEKEYLIRNRKYVFNNVVSKTITPELIAKFQDRINDKSFSQSVGISISTIFGYFVGNNRLKKTELMSIFDHATIKPSLLISINRSSSPTSDSDYSPYLHSIESDFSKSLSSPLSRSSKTKKSIDISFKKKSYDYSKKKTSFIDYESDNSDSDDDISYEIKEIVKKPISSTPIQIERLVIDEKYKKYSLKNILKLDISADDISINTKDMTSNISIIDDYLYGISSIGDDDNKEIIIRSIIHYFVEELTVSNKTSERLNIFKKVINHIFEESTILKSVSYFNENIEEFSESHYESPYSKGYLKELINLFI